MHKVLQSLQLSLLNVGYAHLDTHWNYDNVVSPFTRMYYISKGSAKVYHNDQTFDLKPGYMYLIPSFTYSRYKCDEYHEQYYISFFEEIKNGLSIFNLKSFVYELKAKDTDIAYFKRLLEINPNRALVNDDPEVYDNRPTLQIFKKKNEKLPSSTYLETNGLLYILLSKFIKDHNRLVVKNTTRDNLSQVLSHISENLDKELTINKLASYCHLSTDYFSRIFKQKIGMRPNKYIQSKRVERAQLLLLTTDNSLKQIAEKVGLENLSYFSRVFKSFTGKTPGNFRKEELNV